MSRQTRTRLLRLPQVEARTGLSRAEIYRRVIANPPRFPLPVKCGRASHFVEREVEEWIAAQIAARDRAAVVAIVVDADTDADAGDDNDDHLATALPSSVAPEDVA